ncbi:hypothetical protein P9D80_18430 [Bacillus spizizenii]|uniref:hypothetical protein n=1 Tax=Bacillus spizizenii TaxID=96241 RepID=UPI0011167799|nr:hypothetical protein [Bacillus spizizenii]MCY7866831.1 hypothetical protein [Bacillus spizizenii]MEC1587272.1 hypothetical protein [Bacillus spizizenii]
MNVNQQTYKETETAAKFILEHRKDDKELLIFLTKQDSIMLNQLKVFFSEPQLTFKHTVKIVCFVTFVTLYIYFFSTRFNELIELSVQMFFALIGLFWVFIVFPFSRKVQISERFKQKSENARIVGMIDFVLEQKYKKSISE